MTTTLTKTYNAICAKDGSRFIQVEGDCNVSYNEAVYDLIQEDSKATAQSDLDGRSEAEGTRELENKESVTTAWNNI